MLIRELSRFRGGYRRRATVRGLVIVVAFALFGTTTSGASAQNGDDLHSLLAERTTARERAEVHLRELQDDLAELDAQLAASHASSAELAADLESARSDLRSALTSAYVGGGQQDPSLILFSLPDAELASRRATYLAYRAGDLSDAATRFDALKQNNDPKLVAMVEEREALAAAVRNAEIALGQAKAQEADAERMIAAAEAKAAEDAAKAKAAAEKAEREQQQRAAEAAKATTTAPKQAAPAAPAASASAPTTVAPAQVVPSTTYSGPLPDLPPGGPTPEQWAALRQCESGGNYQIVSASGRYRGAYQFDMQTWAALGGTGDPAAAPPEEQDARARLLYSQRGWRPWPHCGRYLQ